LQTEWWYYSGFLSAGPREFGFCVTFFRGHTARKGVSPSLRPVVRLLFPRFYCPAHFSLADFQRREFRYAHRRPVRGRAGASAAEYRVWTQDWSVCESGGRHRLAAATRGVRLALDLEPAKPLVKHGRDGHVDKGGGQSGLHYSYTRMHAAGMLTLDGTALPVSGSAWMEREAGNWHPNDDLYGWDWLAIQLDDDCELMILRARDSRGRPSRMSYATVIDGENRVERFTADQFSLECHGDWRSPLTGVLYPQGWTLRVPALDLQLDIEPVLHCQELDTRGSTMVIYWEGAATVRGSMGRRPANGRAYVELFGYDLAHRSVSLLDWLRGERMRQRYGAGRTVREK
jgi:predicted secreted hydrolase